MNRTALVTGGNRGIGLEVCRQLAQHGYKVILTSRNLKKGEEAADSISENGDLLVEQLDVRDLDSIHQCARRLQDKELHVDILINNAAIISKGNALEMDYEQWRQITEINLLGSIWTSRQWVPGMVIRDWGRVVNVSSGMGLFSQRLASSTAGYAVTKAALNAFTLNLAQSVPDTIKVNAVSPGWVRTEMGGKHAERSVEEGAESVMWAVTLPDDGPTGGMFRDGNSLDW